MVIYDNEFETKENKIWTKVKIEPQHRYALIALTGKCQNGKWSGNFSANGFVLSDHEHEKSVP